MTFCVTPAGQELVFGHTNGPMEDELTDKFEILNDHLDVAGLYADSASGASNMIKGWVEFYNWIELYSKVKKSA